MGKGVVCNVIILCKNIIATICSLLFGYIIMLPFILFVTPLYDVYRKRKAKQQQTVMVAENWKSIMNGFQIK